MKRFSIVNICIKQEEEKNALAYHYLVLLLSDKFVHANTYKTSTDTLTLLTLRLFLSENPLKDNRYPYVSIDQKQLLYIFGKNQSCL